MKGELAGAIVLATWAHAGQKRSDGSPYIFHPLRVMIAIGSAGGSETENIVAVLHDVVEDTAIEHSRVVSQFGDIVGKALVAITKKNGEDYESAIERVKKNAIARKVKRFDILDNLADLSNSSFKQEKKAELSARYIKALAALR